MINDFYPKNIDGIILDRNEGRYTCFEDVQAIIALIKARDDNRNIIEIGCATGITTKDLAKNFINKKIYAIDSTENNIHDGQINEKPNKNIICSYGKGFPNVIIIDQLSKEVDYLILENVGAIFIDDDHTYEGVKATTEKIIECFTGKNVLIIWHDYYDINPFDWIGVKKYIDEEIDKKYEVHRVLYSNIAWIII
jgi:hypothetical protein